jgi:hypothetical protein
MRIKGCLTGLIFLTCVLTAKAQQVMEWYSPSKVNGICRQDSAHIFYRLPAYMQSQVRPIVWDLSLNTAGEFLHFRTTARSLVVRYGLSGKTFVCIG